MHYPNMPDTSFCHQRCTASSPLHGITLLPSPRGFFVFSIYTENREQPPFTMFLFAPKFMMVWLPSLSISVAFHLVHYLIVLRLFYYIFFGFFCWFREIVGILKKWKLLWFAEGVEVTAWSISWQYEDNCYVADGTWNLDSVNVRGEYAVAKILIPSLNLAYVADRSSPSISILVV